MKIVYYVHDLNFPLREGVRKQAWWLAQAMKKKGHDVEIVSTLGKKTSKKTVVVEGIQIRYGNPFQIAAVDADVVHYISHPSPLLIPLMIFSRAKKHVMTMFDGNLNGFWTRPWYPFVGWLTNRKLCAVTVQTDFQEVLLRGTRVKSAVSVIPPLIPSFEKKVARHEVPTLLFMSHFHSSKGIHEVLDAVELVRKKRNIRLVVANSGMTSHPGIVEKITQLGSVVELKGIVDIQTELAHAWVYLYPVREAQETFSVPLSLIEAQQIGTPYIGTNVGGIGEYFENEHLVLPKDSVALAAKIEQFLDTPVVREMKKTIVNEDVIAQFEVLYKNKSENKSEVIEQ